MLISDGPIEPAQKAFNRFHLSAIMGVSCFLLSAVCVVVGLGMIAVDCPLVGAGLLVASVILGFLPYY